MSDTGTTVALAALGGLLIALGIVPNTWLVAHPVRELVAIPAILVLPGLAAYRAIPVARRIDIAGLTMHAIALSIILTIASGLVLAATPWGITGRGILICLGTFTMTAATARLFSPSHRRIHRAMQHTPVGPAFIHLAVIGVALILLTAAVRIAWSGAVVDQADDVVALWLYVDPSTATASDLWIVAGVRQPSTNGPTTYRIELRYDGNTLNQWDNIAIDAGGTWQYQFRLADYVDSWTEPFDLYLYRSADGPTANPIRWVRLNQPSNARG